jgi:hypothetical protein
MGEEVDYPSFLTAVRALPQPTILDLEQYFPGQRFWKLAFIEQYIVEKTMRAFHNAESSHRWAKTRFGERMRSGRPAC